MKVVLSNLEVIDLEVEDQETFCTVTVGTQVLTVVENKERGCWQEPEVSDDDAAKALSEHKMFHINQEVCLILMSNMKLKVVAHDNDRYQVEDQKGNRTWVTEDELQEWKEINER